MRWACLHYRRARKVAGKLETVRFVGKQGFQIYLLSGLGLAATIVIALVASQVAYSGPAGPLAALLLPDVRGAVILSLGCATVAAALGLVVAVPAAYALARHRFWGAAVLDALLDIPVVLSPIALGLALLLFFRTTAGGWVETYVARFVFEVPGLILAQFILALALEIRVLKATFDDVDPRMEMVARFLGCTPWRAFTRVTLPLSRSGLLAAFILGWARAIGDFGASVTIAGAMSGKTETIPIGVYLRLSSLEIDKAVALMLVLTAIAFVVLFGVRLLGRRGP